MVFVPRRRETVTFRDAALVFKNFAGKKGTYNAEGDRNFNILLDEKTALDLQDQGWNVKPDRKSHESEDGERLYLLKVKVNFGNRSPRCWLVSSGGRNLLGEGLIDMLDQTESIKVDLVIAAYDWDIRGNTGRTAYLQSLFFHMYEDELELEYADVPLLPVSGGDAPKELEPGSRLAYDYEGEVVD